MGIRKDTVEPILRSATEQLEYPETQQDAHTLMAFYVSLRTLMFECGIDDFTINDLAKPDGMRLTRILSYVINFTRFREERAGVIGEHFQKAEKAKEKIEQLYFENEELASRLQALKQQRAKEEPMIKRAKEVQKLLSEELYAFSKREKALTNEMNKLKQEKETYVKTLEDRQFFVTKTLQEAEKIRPYIVDSPDKLQQVITDMGTSLSQEKAMVDSVERKNRALQTSADSFAIVEQDVVSAIKVMEECEQELVKEEENARRAARHHEILTQKQTDVREIERSEQVCPFSPIPLVRRLWDERSVPFPSSTQLTHTSASNANSKTLLKKSPVPAKPANQSPRPRRKRCASSRKRTNSSRRSAPSVTRTWRRRRSASRGSRRRWRI